MNGLETSREQMVILERGELDKISPNEKKEKAKLIKTVSDALSSDFHSVLR